MPMITFSSSANGISLRIWRWLRSPEFGVVETGAHSLHALFHYGRITGGERAMPMLLVHHGMDAQAGFLGRGQYFFGLRMVGCGGTFDLFEAGVARQLKPFHNSKGARQNAELDGFAYGQAGGCGGRHERPGSRYGEERAAG